jgi:hypothetical protein
VTISRGSLPGVFLAESFQGLITDYQVLEGNPADTTQVKTSLDRHEQVFDHPPELYGLSPEKETWKCSCLL